MKILFFNSFSAVQGGAERLLLDTVTNLQSRGHSCCMVVANDDRQIKSTEVWPARTNRYYLPELLIPLSNKSTFNNYRRNKNYRKTISYLQDIINIENPDIIHVHNFPSIEVFNSLEINIPLVRTIHSYENLCRSRMKTLPNGAICHAPLGLNCEETCGIEDNFLAVRVRAENRLMKNHFSRIIAISSWIKEVLLLNGFPANKVATIANFTNLKPQPLLPQKAAQVLFVGRLTPEKGVLELIHAISKTKSKPILNVLGANGLLGQNEYEKTLLSEAEALGVKIRIKPWAEKEELKQAYQNSKIVAFSSNWPEPFGLVGIEAMMYGKPVIGFDVGGIKDWLTDGITGFLIPPLNTDLFAERIDQLIAEPQLSRQMGEVGQRHVLERFSSSRHMDQLIDLYQEVIRENTAH